MRPTNEVPTLAEWRSSARYFEQGAARLAYWTEGNGPTTTVLLHGFPTASYDWNPIWRELSQDRRVAALDMLGFGFSDKPRGADYSVMAQADRIASWLANLGTAEIDLIGHDVGGSVTQEFLARQSEGRLPIEIRSVVLLNGGLFPETHYATTLQKILAGPLGPAVNYVLRSLPSYPRLFKRSFSKILGEGHQNDQRLLEDAWQLVHHNGGEALAPVHLGYIAERRQNRERWVSALRDAQLPIRLVNGSADPVSGEHMAKRYEELIPSPDVVRLAGVGHYPQLEAPDRLLAAIGDFPRGR